jgi:hypothetical protein
VLGSGQRLGKGRERNSDWAGNCEAQTGGSVKVSIRKTDYARKAPGFSVWVVDDAGAELFCAHPETYEHTAKLAAAAFASLIKTQGGRALVLAAAVDLG